jgi:hypothetical protein
MTQTVPAETRGAAYLGETVDGRKHLVCSQSWLNTLRDCPERARRDLLGLSPRVNTDATALGTAVHAALESACRIHMGTGKWPSLNDCHDLFDADWLSELERIDKWVNRTEQQASGYGRQAVAAWWWDIKDQLDPIGVEITLGPHPIIDNDEWLVELQGTCDLLDHNWGLVDWKTSGRKWVGWEKIRWAIQPTVYDFLLRQDEPFEKYPRNTFTYVVMVDDADATVQTLQVERGPEWDGWLRAQIGSNLPLMTATELWPKNDESALCSPKWCPAWAECKGAHVVSPKWVQTPKTV